MFGKPSRIPTSEEALPGRSTPMIVPDAHYVNGHRIQPPFPEGLELAMFGLGCFWGAEKNSGSRRAFTRPRLATPRGIHPIPLIAKYAAG